MTVRGTQGVTQDQESVSSMGQERGTSSVPRTLAFPDVQEVGGREDRLAEVVQQLVSSASLRGVGQPLHLCSLLVPSAK